MRTKGRLHEGQLSKIRVGLEKLRFAECVRQWPPIG